MGGAFSALLLSVFLRQLPTRTISSDWHDDTISRLEGVVYDVTSNLHPRSPFCGAPLLAASHINVATAGRINRCAAARLPQHPALSLCQLSILHHVPATSKRVGCSPRDRSRSRLSPQARNGKGRPVRGGGKSSDAAGRRQARGRRPGEKNKNAARCAECA